MMLSLRRHSGLRLLLVALALLAGVAVHYFSRPVFYSRALVRLSEPGSLERARIVAKELTQPQLLERTAGRLGLKVAATELQKLYLFDVQAQAVSAAEIEVKVWAHSRAWAETWAKALVAECGDFRRVRRRKETADAIRGMNREMSEIAGKIGSAGARKFEANDKAGLVKQLAEIDDLRNPAREIEPLAKRIEELGRIHADLRDPGKPMVDKLAIIAAVEQRAGTGETGTKPAWEVIEERREPLLEELAMIEFVSIAPDATALAIGNEILELDGKLQIEFDTNFRRFDVDYRNLVDQKAALEEKAAQPARPADTALNLRLQHLRQRVESLGVAETDGGDPVFAKLLENRGRPVSPDALKIALLSLLGGGVLALGVPLFADRFGAARTKLSQLESSTGLGALGVIPAILNLPSRKPVLADREDERLAPMAEIFQSIRTSLLADAAAPRVLMITSAVPGEGKTMTAANLGIAFAETGVRTLVIDTDMRRARLHRLFGYRPAPGLDDVLSGAIPATKAIRPTPHQNLYVMNAGKAPGPEIERLASDAFAKMIAQLRDSLDLLILDAPPVLGLPATATLAPHTDAALLVVSSAQTSPKAAGAAAEMLRGSGAKVRGFVVNQHA